MWWITMTCSRLFLGVHSFPDIIGGVVLGCMVANTRSLSVSVSVAVSLSLSLSHSLSLSLSLFSVCLSRYFTHTDLLFSTCNDCMFNLW
jgi:uncharacterized membrane protein